MGTIALLIAALSTLAGAGTAAAETTTCKVTADPCPAGQNYGAGTEIKSELVSGTEFVSTSGAGEVKCKKASITRKIETATTPKGKISSWNLSDCNRVIKVLKAGEIIDHHSGSHNGELTWSGLEVTIDFSGLSCFYGGEVKAGFTVKGGAPATEEMQATTISGLPGNSLLCPSSVSWDVKWTVTSPSPMYLTTGI